MSARLHRLLPTLFLLPLLQLGACNRPSEPPPGPGVPAKASAGVLPSAAPAISAEADAGEWKGGLHGSPDEFKAPPRPKPDGATEITAVHILIAYKGALDAGPNVTRSKEEAEKLAKFVGIQVRSGADFEELVRKFSDDPSAKENHGNLGKFKRADKVKPFSDAAFDLMKMEVTGEPIETPYGFHLIRRTG